MARLIVTSLCWTGTLSAAVLICVARFFPVRLDIVNDDTLFACLLQTELAFAFFAWPLLASARMRDALVETAVIVVLGIPLTVLCADISNVAVGSLVASQALVGAILLLGGLVTASIKPHYYFGAFLTQAALPYLYYLIREYGSGDPAAAFVAINPFWAVARGESLVLQIAIFGSLALATALSRRRTAKPVDVPAKPG